jgi:hypothetical protein
MGRAGTRLELVHANVAKPTFQVGRSSHRGYAMAAIFQSPPSCVRGAVGLLALVGAAVAIGGPMASLTGAAPAGAASSVAVPDKCSNPDPPMPPSTGTQTPSGFSVQMTGAVLAPASDANTLAEAYYEWNDMRCSEYTHHYRWQPPDFYYYDCVGFTGYTTSVADPTAWSSVRQALHIGSGYVPTPLHFEEFFNSLPTTPEAGWQAVPDVGAIRPGDILAWQPAEPDGQPDLSGVGHSVMPLVQPQPIAGSNDTRWEVVVMDSTAGGHGPDDTRQSTNPLSARNAPILTKSKSVEPSGLGIGTIALDTDASGNVTGVEWQVDDKPEPIVFGAGHPLNDSGPAPGPTPTPPPGPNPEPASYDLATSTGVVSSFGGAYNYGPTSPLALNKPIAGLAATTDGNGYWEASSDGGVFAYGTAPFLGSMGGQSLAAPVVGIAGTEDMDGYWEAAADGGVFAYGTAPFLGSMGGRPLTAPVDSLAADPIGSGYWLAAADGGVFTFGDAGYFGSMGGQTIAAPVVGIVATPDGQGYWLVAKDGGIFAFGDAGYYGSLGGQALTAPIVSMGVTSDGGGYWEFGSDGSVFAFGDATYAGRMTSSESGTVVAGIDA